MRLSFKGTSLRFESFFGWVWAVVCESRDVWLSKSSVFLASLRNVCTQEPLKVQGSLSASTACS